MLKYFHTLELSLFGLFKFQWQNLNDPTIYTFRNLFQQFTNNFYQIIYLSNDLSHYFSINLSCFTSCAQLLVSFNTLFFGKYTLLNFL